VRTVPSERLTAIFGGPLGYFSDIAKSRIRVLRPTVFGRGVLMLR
jgi:hypothetical protein